LQNSAYNKYSNTHCVHPKIIERHINEEFVNFEVKPAIEAFDDWKNASGGEVKV
jgi:hypothetical protein